jgi:hypothetical protein
VAEFVLLRQLGGDQVRGGAAADPGGSAPAARVEVLPEVLAVGPNSCNCHVRQQFVWGKTGNATALNDESAS